MNKKHSEKGLMLVEDPEETLQALCNLANGVITWDSFKTEYERVTNRLRKPVDEKTIDTHFYSLTIFEILEELDKGKYQISLTGNDLCRLRKTKSKIYEFKSLLASILLNNPSKGKLFEKFLNFLKTPRKKSEIYEQFKPEPSRSLISWCSYSGLIEIQGKDYWSLPIHREKISKKDFRKILIDTYKEMRDTKMFGIKRTFVDIDDLRKNICARLGIRIEEFDKFLTEILVREKGKLVRLFGAPSSQYDEGRNFMYKNKLYAEISLDV